MQSYVLGLVSLYRLFLEENMHFHSETGWDHMVLSPHTTPCALPAFWYVEMLVKEQV